MIRFTIPGLPPSGNVTMRWHWAKRNRENRAWYLRITLAVFEARANGAFADHDERRLGEFTPPRRRVTMTRVGGRQMDLGNRQQSMKPILDGIVRAGLLVDDSPKWCDERPVGWRRKARDEQPHVEIVIEDCEAIEGSAT